jgi:hypothetical protein
MQTIHTQRTNTAARNGQRVIVDATNRCAVLARTLRGYLRAVVKPVLVVVPVYGLRLVEALATAVRAGMALWCERTMMPAPAKACGDATGFGDSSRTAFGGSLSRRFGSTVG